MFNSAAELLSDEQELDIEPEHLLKLRNLKIKLEKLCGKIRTNRELLEYQTSGLTIEKFNDTTEK